MIPERIGRYKVIKELGSGSMATVYLAEDPFIKRQVAIKIILSEYTANVNFEDRFRYEAQVVANLNHPAIVPIYDFGFHGEQLFIVMQFMSGGSLDNHLEADISPNLDITTTITRIASVLDKLHENNLIHRDIKPGNILFDGQQQAYLSDFGIAKNVKQPKGFTATDITLGTVDYMSPEQINSNKNLDGRTDIYALGVVLFYMLTRDLPFSRATVVGTAMAHISDPIPSVNKTLPKLNSSWDAILNKAMAKNREDRYATAGEMAADVEALLPL